MVGGLRLRNESIEINKGRRTCSITVANTGDRPIQVGSHFHFAEVNRELQFAREQAIGMRLNVAAGTAMRFEPGEEKEVELVAIAGNQKIFGFNNLTKGSIENLKDITHRLDEAGFQRKEGR
ncbi:urease subunit beta [Gracilibacillus halophilus YIM-C55.5]|uniref:Urease subunit beta n=1 Tax=Gracilibacillus halophilus YIM-C55.5 TaxID=1308866 RepID=N4WHF9_9BACI|nr:urease subunit beta [Gracilibacillus halophilus YIM-C55.5]